MTANLTFKRKLPLGELSKDKSVNKFFSGGVRKSFSLACPRRHGGGSVDPGLLSDRVGRAVRGIE